MKLLTIFLVFVIFSKQAFAENSINEYFSFLGFELELSTIQNVIDKIGHARIHRDGDAASSYTGVCYQNPKQGITVYFESGEMGGAQNTLLSFQVLSKANRDFPCGTLADGMANKLSIGALKLGEPIEKVLTALPKNIYEKSNLKFTYMSKIPFTEEEIDRFEVKNIEYAFWHQFAQIEVFSGKEKVIGYRVSKVTSW